MIDFSDIQGDDPGNGTLFLLFCKKEISDRKDFTELFRLRKIKIDLQRILCPCPWQGPRALFQGGYQGIDFILFYPVRVQFLFLDLFGKIFLERWLGVGKQVASSLFYTLFQGKFENGIFYGIVGIEEEDDIGEDIF